VVPEKHHRRRKRPRPDLSGSSLPGLWPTGVLDVGGQIQFHLRKAPEDGGGTAIADYVWKPVVLAARIQRGEPVTAPSMPENYPEPAKFAINRRCAIKTHSYQ
jgi:hypothetical protein